MITVTKPFFEYIVRTYCIRSVDDHKLREYHNAHGQVFAKCEVDSRGRKVYSYNPAMDKTQPVLPKCNKDHTD